jgi:glycosyltransferase involved in cell wall biosynthesis
MKIVIVGPAYPLRGAMAQLNVILGWYLSKNHDVHIVSFTRQYPSLLFPGKSQIDPGKPLFDIPTLPMIDSINPLSWFRTARYLIEQNPDVLIFRYWIPFFAPCFGLITRMVKRKTHAQVIFICDNIIPHEKRPGDKALTKYAFNAVDAFVVLSRTVEEDLHRIRPKARSILSPLPLFNVYGELQQKREARMKLELHAEHVMLFFGYVRAYKGLEVLLDAMPRIIEKIPVLLLIAGEFYEDKKKYVAKIRKLGLEKHVRIYSDYIPNEEISTYFSAADVVVLPYVSATQSAIVPVAYHFNKPVIVTNVGGLAEVVTNGRTGFIVPPQNPNAFADAVVKFYQEKCESGFTLNIQKEKKQYGWDTFIERLESLFE